MTDYFMDTSALVKYYHPEDGTQAVTRLIEEPTSRHYISRLSLVETLSAFVGCGLGRSIRPGPRAGHAPPPGHGHRGLGTLYAVTGQPEQARIELTTAIARYRDTDMIFWQPQAEAALARVEEL